MSWCSHEAANPILGRYFNAFQEILTLLDSKSRVRVVSFLFLFSALSSVLEFISFRLLVGGIYSRLGKVRWWDNARLWYGDREDFNNYVF